MVGRPASAGREALASAARRPWQGPGPGGWILMAGTLSAHHAHLIAKTQTTVPKGWLFSGSSFVYMPCISTKSIGGYG